MRFVRSRTSGAGVYAESDGHAERRYEMLQEPQVDWNLRGQAFSKQFKEHAQVVRGVYAHLETNEVFAP
jgi:hypothetical protein